MIDRRQMLSRGMLGASLLALPRIAVAALPTERRFVFVIQRGAADGLDVVRPVGDPAFGGLRGALVDAPGTKLDAMFALHPALTQTAALYASGQALFVHATGSGYGDRSHFDGQNVLETGGNAPYRLKDGWLNRLLALMPNWQGEAIALSPSIPAALRGRIEVASYAPTALPAPTDDLLARVGALYQGDAQLHALWSQAMETRSVTSDLADAGGKNGAATGALAARLLTDGGARIAMIETGGWDTHSGQKGRLNAQLGGLDALIGSLKAGLGAAWSNTVVLIATEFGRTVAVNGTGGTDHGTASAAMLIGGAVRGGRVIADWPGLGNAALVEARDLRATTDLGAVIAGALAQHYRLDPARVAAALFPDRALRLGLPLIRA